MTKIDYSADSEEIMELLAEAITERSFIRLKLLSDLRYSKYFHETTYENMFAWFTGVLIDTNAISSFEVHAERKEEDTFIRINLNNGQYYLFKLSEITYDAKKFTIEGYYEE